MIVVNRVTHLPAGFGVLVDAATAESMRMVQRLADEYRSGANRFDMPGEGLWEARSDDRLIGICGLNADPYAVPEERCGRVRRLYVLPEWRRRGAGSALVAAIEAHAADRFSKLTAFTIDPNVISFYLARGFRPANGSSRRSVELELAGRY